jgi:hypothetical protein|eukprot:g1187.t1 g1187   contig10:1565697-1566110(+)
MPATPFASSPTKVYQDDFSPGKGNALQAAVASLFGLTLMEVPNFIEMPDGYEAAIREFSQRRGFECIKIALGDSKKAADEYVGKHCILRGKSPRGNFGHVVVARYSNGNGFEMVHDPHPEENFLDTSESYGWCMFFV